MRGRVHRKDQNHDQLCGALRKQGWMVFETHHLDGFVDALAVKQSRCVFIEFKAGRGPAERKPKPHQIELHNRLRAAGAEVAVVEKIEDLAQFERPTDVR